MKIVLDKNVFVSGVFFTGPPSQILKAWRDDRIQPVISPEIIDEYHRVGKVLAEQFPSVDLDPIIGLRTVEAQSITAPPLPEPVCDDPDDDKFLACAAASEARSIVTGDRHLLRVSTYRGARIVHPQDFLEVYL